MNKKLRQLVVFLIGLTASIGFDQWTKVLAVTHLKEQPPFVIWDGVFELYYSENRGAAFGMLQGQQGIFFVIAVVVIAVVAWTLYKMPAERRYLPFTFCLFLLVSGAAGNMIDRVSNGFVVDFLYFKLIDFPIFNVADCYVVVSTCLLILLSFFYYSEEELDFLSFGKKAAEKEVKTCTEAETAEADRGAAEGTSEPETAKTTEILAGKELDA